MGSKFLDRKFLLCLLAILGASFFLWLRLLDGGQWVTAVGGALLVFTSGDVAQGAWGKGDGAS